MATTDELLAITQAETARVLDQYRQSRDLGRVPEPTRPGLPTTLTIDGYLPSLVTADAAGRMLLGLQRLAVVSTYALAHGSPDRSLDRRLTSLDFVGYELAIDYAVNGSLQVRLRAIGDRILAEARTSPIQFCAAAAFLASIALPNGTSSLTVSEGVIRPDCQIAIQGEVTPELVEQARHVLGIPGECTITIDAKTPAMSIEGSVAAP